MTISKSLRRKRKKKINSVASSQRGIAEEKYCSLSKALEIDCAKSWEELLISSNVSSEEIITLRLFERAVSRGDNRFVSVMLNAGKLIIADNIKEQVVSDDHFNALNFSGGNCSVLHLDAYLGGFFRRILGEINTIVFLESNEKKAQEQRVMSLINNYDEHFSDLLQRVISKLNEEEKIELYEKLAILGCCKTLGKNILSLKKLSFDRLLDITIRTIPTLQQLDLFEDKNHKILTCKGLTLNSILMNGRNAARNFLFTLLCEKITNHQITTKGLDDLISFALKNTYFIGDFLDNIRGAVQESGNSAHLDTLTRALATFYTCLPSPPGGLSCGPNSTHTFFPTPRRTLVATSSNSNNHKSIKDSKSIGPAAAYSAK